MIRKDFKFNEWGTCYFPTLKHAIRYYSDYEENPRAAVAVKLNDGLIHLGKPPLKEKQIAYIKDNRYFIKEN